jgi:DNA-binding MarR family transcriptional regulator
MNQSRAIDKETMVLLRHLVRMGKAAEARMDSVLDEVDLSSTRMMALCQVAQANGQISLGQLASQLAFVKSNATQLVDRLEADGLVRRVHSEDDRRCTLIELTDEGQRYLEAGFQALAPLQDQFAQMYTPEERAQLLSLVNRLCNSWPR